MLSLKIHKLHVLIILFILTQFVNTSNGETIILNVYPQNSVVNQNPVSMTLSGKLYAEAIWLENISVGKTQASADETFIAKVVTMNQVGTPTDVLNTWSPDEQAQMGTYINDPNLFAANQTWYKTIKKSAFLAKISFGEYTVFMVQHTMQDASNISKLYSIKLVNSMYYMTNQLSNDPIYVYYMPNISKQITFKTIQQ